MKHKVRLGPIAIFLTVVAMILVTMALLTVSTARADTALAQRFADVTKTRYALEAEGQKFLQKYDEQIVAGAEDPARAVDAEKTEKGIEKTITADGYTLQIRVSAPDGEGNWEVTQWKINKEWNEEDPFGNVWKGGE